MQAFTRSVFDLFAAKKRYLVPMFQRPYVWGLEKQWEPLWEDVQRKAQEHLGGQDVDPHFMGAIVINQLRTFGPAIPAHEIIDGQQRLTTFQLFLAAFRDVATEFGDEDVATELTTYTLNSGKKASTEEEFKVWPTRADQQAFAEVLRSGSREALEQLHPPVLIRRQTQPRHKMVEAYLFFEKAIRSFIWDESAETANDRMQALFSALQNSLQLVSIELETKDDPQVIFETLNARGEPLLSSDLLRNFLFLRAKRQELPANELYDRYWEPFDTTPSENGDSEKVFWKVEERQGRLVRPRLDLFIQHFLSLKTGRDVNVGRLFHDYRQWVETESPYPSVEEELKELRRYSLVFAKFFVPDTSTDLGKFIVRLQGLLDTNTIYPFLLYLEADSGLPGGERAEILRDLESYLVRRIVCGYTEKNYNRLFLQLIRALRDAPSPSSRLFRSMLQDMQGESSCWPDDDKFEEAWLVQPIYRTAKSSKRVEAMLRAIEEFQLNERREKIRILGALSIEHVMPQAWEEKWPAPCGLASAEVRDTLIHTFGNLTLLTSKLNSSVSNSSFDDKKPEIIKQSALQINTYFQDLQHWDDGEIRRRGAHLFSYAVRIWPFARSSSVPSFVPVIPTAKAVPEPCSFQVSCPGQITSARNSSTGSEVSRDRGSAAVSRKLVTQNDGDGSLGERQLQFWNAFVEFLKASKSQLRPNKPYPQNWIYLPLCPGGFKLEATVVSSGDPRISCGITIQRPDARAVLAYLKQHRGAIEREFGAPLDWESRNERSEIECHVQVHSGGVNLLAADDWSQHFEWMQSAVEDLRRAFLPFVGGPLKVLNAPQKESSTRVPFDGAASQSELQQRFQEEMLRIYESAKACGYNPARFLQMIHERGGLATARSLLQSQNVSEGFTKLWELGRLDLTVEALVLRSPWSQLFTEGELRIAKARLS